MASDTSGEPWVRRPAREFRNWKEAWAPWAEPAFHIPLESSVWRAEQACHTLAAKPPGERAAPAAAAWAWKTRACIRSDPAEWAAEEALPEEPALTLAEYPAP